MPTPSGRINETERLICERVQRVRNGLGLTQAELAAETGITRSQLAAIESAVTPLRYEIAWRLRHRFLISLRWLAKGEGFPTELAQDALPEPRYTGLPARALLSSVALKHPRPERPKLSATVSNEEETGEVDAAHRLFVEQVIITMAPEWVCQAPIGKTDQLLNDLENAAKRLNVDAPSVVSRRWEALARERFRKDAMHSLAEILSTSPLTTTSLKRKSQAVTEIQKLLDRANKVTAAPGMKAWLAAKLKVPQSRVSEWLAGKKEPLGDATLRMQQWVAYLERQQKAPKVLKHLGEKTHLKKSA